MRSVPAHLRTWFHVHFIVDMIFALPLMIAPVWVLGMLGFSPVDPFATRLVAAALFGIGGVSTLLNSKGTEFYKSMLTLKLIWSGTAVVGLVWTLLSTPVFMGWIIAAIFAAFFILWGYYYRQF